MIEVRRKSDQEFVVVVTQKQTKTEHTVILDDKYHKSLTQGKINKEDLIKKSFEFLLEREPKESILPRFNLRVINDYFPEFEGEIRVERGK